MPIEPQDGPHPTLTPGDHFSDRLEMLAFEAELARLPRSLILAIWEVINRVHLAMDLPFRNAPQIQAFVHAAVRLPHSRLRTIDLEWESLHIHTGVIRELEQVSRDLRREMEQLREYVTQMARQAEAGAETHGPLLPEDIAEAVLPAARAVLLRDLLEFSEDQRRARAFTALIEPFRDILPRTRYDGERRGDR